MNCEATPINILARFDERLSPTTECDRPAVWVVILNRPSRPENGRRLHLCDLCRHYDYRMHSATLIQETP